MRYKNFIHKNKQINEVFEINKILKSYGLNWLIDSEIEEAELEIKNNTLIWHNGIFYTGNWKFGIFKNGKFYGKFENGIFEKGEFNGIWISGIKNNK